MNPGLLPMAMANASVFLDEGLAPMLGKTATLAEALEFCGYLRQRGIASFLLSSDPDELCRELCASAHAFLHVLPSIPASVQATSEFVPFFDALAAGDLDAARTIAQQARPTWNPAEELEEDFLYLSLIMSLLVSPPGAALGEPSFQTRLARYQELADGNDEDELKLAIVNGLVGRNDEEFGTALAERMKQLQQRYRRLAANLSMPEEEAATSGSVSVEGLALVRLARLLGLEPASDYRLVPGLALEASASGPAGAAWQRPYW
jgi:hypothetical protein